MRRTCFTKEAEKHSPSVQAMKCYAIVESYLRYADVIRGSLPARKIETLQRLRNKAKLIIETVRVKDNWYCDWWLNVSNLISNL